MGNRKRVYSLVIDLDSFATKPRMQTEQVQKDRLRQFVAMAQKDREFNVFFVAGYLNSATQRKFRQINPKISFNGVSTSRLNGWDDLPEDIDVIISPHTKEDLSMLAPDHVVHINPDDIQVPYSFLKFKKEFIVNYEHYVANQIASQISAMTFAKKAMRWAQMGSLFENPKDVLSKALKTPEAVRLLEVFEPSRSKINIDGYSEAEDLLSEYFQLAAEDKYKIAKEPLDAKAGDADLIRGLLRSLFPNHNIDGLYPTTSTDEALKLIEEMDEDEFLEYFPDDIEIDEKDFAITSDDFPVMEAHNTLIENALMAIKRVVDQTPRKQAPAP